MDVSHPIQSVLRTLDGPILEVLAGTSRPLSLTKLTTLSGNGSLSGVRLAVLRLVDHGIVEAVPGGYQLNREHLAAPAILHLAGMRHELVQRIGRLADGWDTPPILLGVFGSFARRDGDEHSDIDLLLVSDSPDSDEQAGLLSSSVQMWTGNPCHVVSLRHSDLAQLQLAGEGIVDRWRQDLQTIRGDASVLVDLPGREDESRAHQAMH